MYDVSVYLLYVCITYQIYGMQRDGKKTCIVTFVQDVPTHHHHHLAASSQHTEERIAATLMWLFQSRYEIFFAIKAIVSKPTLSFLPITLKHYRLFMSPHSRQILYKSVYLIISVVFVYLYIIQKYMWVGWFYLCILYKNNILIPDIYYTNF